MHLSVPSALSEIAGTARVVAIGEGAHFVSEFSAVRAAAARTLAATGRTVFAFEFDFATAPAIDRWLTGDDPRVLHEVSPAAANWGASTLLHALRDHNRTGAAPLRFAGIDLPEAGGALRPVLEPLADLVDPASRLLVDTALRISDSFLAGLGSGAAAAPAWARLAPAQQHELTATLARLRLRLQALPNSARAERLIAAACVVDHSFRAMNDLYAGTPHAADLSARDVFMTETVLWHLDNSPPGTRILLAAHNNHIQKTPISFDGTTITSHPMGEHLARALGDDYVAVAVTHTAGNVPEMRLDPRAAVGFKIEDVELPAPEDGSVEAAMVKADKAFLDLRGTRDEFTSIRTQSAVMRTPVAKAFDAVIAVPTVTRDPTVPF